MPRRCDYIYDTIVADLKNITKFAAILIICRSHCVIINNFMGSEVQITLNFRLKFNFTTAVSFVFSNRDPQPSDSEY